MAEHVTESMDIAELLGSPRMWAEPRLSMTSVIIGPGGNVENKVAPLRTHRNHIASWHVFNDSDRDLRVAVTNFRLKGTQDPPDPEVGRPFAPVDVPARASRYIRGQVYAPDVDKRIYDYEIQIGAAGGRDQVVIQDPDYEIWP